MGAAVVADSGYIQASRLAIQAREDGRAASSAWRGLASCPHIARNEFYLASSWMIGWQEAEREAAGAWLPTLLIRSSFRCLLPCVVLPQVIRSKFIKLR